MQEVGVHEAKTNLSRLLRLVTAGEEIIITRGGTPVARIVPMVGGGQRVLGRDRGLFRIPDDFNAPLGNDLLDAFEQ